MFIVWPKKAWALSRDSLPGGTGTGELCVTCTGLQVGQCSQNIRSHSLKNAISPLICKVWGYGIKPRDKLLTVQVNSILMLKLKIKMETGESRRMQSSTHPRTCFTNIWCLKSLINIEPQAIHGLDFLMFNKYLLSFCHKPSLFLTSPQGTPEAQYL